MTTYPPKIVLTKTAETYIDKLGEDLLLGHLELAQLPPSLLQFWTFGYCEGRASLEPTVAALEHDNDRLYYELCQRLPKPRGEYISWEALQARREALTAKRASGDLMGDDRVAS